MLVGPDEHLRVLAIRETNEQFLVTMFSDASNSEYADDSVSTRHSDVKDAKCILQ